MVNKAKVLYIKKSVFLRIISDELTLTRFLIFDNKL